MKNLNIFTFSERFKKGLAKLPVLAIILSFTLVACETEENEDQQDAFEPNNEWTNASSVSLDKLYNARIMDDSDDDYYLFTTAHSSETYDIVSFQFTGVGKDMKICAEILDENGQSLASAHSKTPGANWTYNLTCPGGTYIINVDGDDGWETYTGPYAFKISNLDSNDTHAPNHAIESAASVSMNEDLHCTILSYDEEDFFMFTNENTNYWQKFNLSFNQVSSEFQVHYEIMDANRQSITDGSASDQGANASAQFPTKSDKIYVKVWGYDYYLNTKGNCILNLSVADANDDNEPDDTFADAREISSFPSGDINGSIVCKAANNNDGDYEFFKVNVKAGKKVQFTVDPAASNTEMHFGIYNADESYTGNNKDGSDGETLNYYLDNPSASDVVLYIKLGAFPGDNGDYTISFTETTAD